MQLLKIQINKQNFLGKKNTTNKEGIELVEAERQRTERNGRRKLMKKKLRARVTQLYPRLFHFLRAFCWQDLDWITLENSSRLDCQARNVRFLSFFLFLLFPTLLRPFV